MTPCDLRHRAKQMRCETTDDGKTAEMLEDAADTIERLRAKVAAVERLTQSPTVDGPNGASLRLASIRAELGVAVNDPRLND